MICLTRAIASTVVLSLAIQSPAHAYLKLGTNLGPAKWNTIVRYFVSDAAAVPGVSPTQFQAALDRAFSTWEDQPTSTVSFQFVGFTGARPLEDDGISTLGFLSRPDLDRVLATTDFLLDSRTGAIIESDIFFNSSFPWSVATAGQAGRYDVESIGVHEIGHMIGLGHSAIGETELQPDGGRHVLGAASVMFPIAFAAGNIADRVLRADDIAGVSDIYPTSGFQDDTGTISGRVTLNGTGVLGAHVVAYDISTGALVGGFSLDAQGRFGIAGLRPGAHLLRAEPLDDGDVESFFSPNADVEVGFKVTFHDRLIVVPRGGEAPAVEVRVVPK